MGFSKQKKTSIMHSSLTERRISYVSSELSGRTPLTLHSDRFDNVAHDFRNLHDPAT